MDESRVQKGCLLFFMGQIIAVGWKLLTEIWKRNEFLKDTSSLIIDPGNQELCFITRKIHTYQVKPDDTVSHLHTICHKVIFSKCVVAAVVGSKGVPVQLRTALVTAPNLQNRLVSKVIKEIKQGNGFIQFGGKQNGNGEVIYYPTTHPRSENCHK